MNISGETLREAEEALSVLNRILAGMGIDASTSASVSGDRLILNISSGPDDNILIGINGRTLDAIQLLVNRILKRERTDRKPFIIDINGFRERRRNNLVELAHRSAEEAVNMETPVTIGPYNAYERHIIHSALKDDANVTTESQGDGSFKEIVITPRLSGEDNGSWS